MAILSIIMPVYNVEPYVSKTIESVLQQKFNDFEFFAVDDGSPDKSGEICEQYAQKDPRMHVIHQKNKGAPAARNAALDIATGKYVYFIDSDDWIENDMLEKMVNEAEKNKADLVVTSFCMEYYQNGKDVTYRNPCPSIVYESIDDFHHDAYKYLNNSLLSLACNKLFLNSVIQEKNLRFPNTKWDDHHFCMNYLMECKKVVFCSMTKYHWYRSRKGSETMINYSDPKMFEKRKEHFQHILKVYNHWGVHDKNSIDGISCYYAGRMAQCIQELADNNMISNNEKILKITEIINDPLTIDALKNAKSLSVKMKIILIPLKMKNAKLCFLMGKMISLVRKIMPGLFIHLKESEVHG